MKKYEKTNTIDLKDNNPKKIYFHIYYLVHFWNSNNNINTLIDFTSKVNIMTFIYTLKLGFQA